MQPNKRFSQSAGYSQQQRKTFKMLVVFGIGLVIILIIVAALSVHKNSQFRVVNTSPDINNVGLITPTISFNFNEELNSEGLQVTSKPAIISKTELKDKSLVITLLTPLKLNQQYTITIGSISSVGGSKLTDLIYKFNAKEIDYNKLPADQQATIMQQQVDRPASKDNYSYIGESLFYDNGFTQDQVSNLKQALFMYFTASKLDVSTVTVNTVTPAVPHPDDPLAPDSPPADPDDVPEFPNPEPGPDPHTTPDPATGPVT